MTKNFLDLDPQVFVESYKKNELTPMIAGFHEIHRGKVCGCALTALYFSLDGKGSAQKIVENVCGMLDTISKEFSVDHNNLRYFYGGFDGNGISEEANEEQLKYYRFGEKVYNAVSAELEFV